MWKKGAIGIPKEENEYTAVRYWAKVYIEPSEYGINGGKISKLMLKINGELVANYDRGWDVEPTCQEAETALSILLSNYK